MYVGRVRETLINFNKDEKEQFIEKLHKNLQYSGREYKPKRKDAELMFKSFIKSNNTRVGTFELILLTLDNLSVGGAIDVLKGKDVKRPKNWRGNLSIFITTYIPPENIEDHFQNEIILSEIKKLFKNTIEFCSHKNIGDFEKNLILFNKFLNIKIKEVKKGGR